MVDRYPILQDAFAFTGEWVLRTTAPELPKVETGRWDSTPARFNTLISATRYGDGAPIVWEPAAIDERTWGRSWADRLIALPLRDDAGFLALCDEAWERIRTKDDEVETPPPPITDGPVGPGPDIGEPPTDWDDEQPPTQPGEQPGEDGDDESDDEDGEDQPKGKGKPTDEDGDDESDDEPQPGEGEGEDEDGESDDATDGDDATDDESDEDGESGDGDGDGDEDGEDESNGTDESGDSMDGADESDEQGDDDGDTDGDDPGDGSDDEDADGQPDSPDGEGGGGNAHANANDLRDEDEWDDSEVDQNTHTEAHKQAWDYNADLTEEATRTYANTGVTAFGRHGKITTTWS
jgi:hypothetical protein